MSFDLHRKVVLVTGASSGIGEKTAREFAARGAHVALISERPKDLEEVASSIQASGGVGLPFVADLTKPAQVENLVATVEQGIGPIDILVNNAGIGMSAKVLDTSPIDLRTLFEVNFFAVESLSRQALCSMAKRKFGRIINVSSGAGRTGLPGVCAYSATKGAVHTYSQALRVEARMHGVFVTEVLPISVRTAFFDNAKGERYKPGGVVITAETVARSIVSAASRNKPPVELLPFPYIRLAFIVEAIWPALMRHYLLHNYRKSETPLGPSRKRSSATD